jgi:hypothetical protein
VEAAQLATAAHYAEALAIYEAAYARVAEPRLLLNIGRCHFRLGRARKALESFEAFQKAMPDAEPEVLKRLAQYKIDAKTAIVSEEGTAPPSNTEASIPEEEPPPAPLDPRAGQFSVQDFIHSRPRWRLGLGLGLSGAGVLLVAIGAGILAVNGTCVSPAPGGLCNAMVNAEGQYVTLVSNSIGTGVGVLVPGILLLGGGVTLIVLPGKRAKLALSSSLRSAPSLSFSF